jgi:hypothetical protein
VQSNVLSKMSDPALRVFVVWVPFMSGSKGAINPAVLPDSRVTSLWDGNAISSRWFSRHVTHQAFPTWDYYMLFPPSARWASVPGPIASQGGPMISVTGQLLASITPMLH